MDAGQAGAFLIKLAGDQSEEALSAKKVAAFARACGMGRKTMEQQLNILRALGAVDWNEDKTEYRVLALSRDRVLRTADEIFRTAVPQGKDAELPEFLEFCLRRPRFADEVKEVFVPPMKERDVTHLLDLLASFRVLGCRTINGRKLYFNTYQFTNSAEKIGKALDAFSQSERAELDDLLNEVARKPGLPMENVKVSEKVRKMAVGLGLVEVSRVESPAGVAEFLTAPLLARPTVGKEREHLEDDVFHHAKILLSSLRYGETHSSAGRGRIIDPRWIVNGLLNRDSVGPCTAIGQDYVLLEKEGVVATTRAYNRSGEQYSMSLRRREPAEIVRNLLQSPSGLAAMAVHPSFQMPNSYTAPDEIRDPTSPFEVDPKTARDFLEALRS